MVADTHKDYVRSIDIFDGYAHVYPAWERHKHGDATCTCIPDVDHEWRMVEHRPLGKLLKEDTSAVLERE